MKNIVKFLFIYIFCQVFIYTQSIPHKYICKKPHFFSNFNQLNKKINHQDHIDVTFYDISLEIDLDNENLIGNVLTQLKKLSESNDKILFNISDHLNVENVRINGSSIDFIHNNDILEIEIPLSIEEKILNIEIKYNGIPFQGNNSGITFLERFDQKLNNTLLVLTYKKKKCKKLFSSCMKGL